MKTSEFKKKLFDMADFYIGESKEWTIVSFNSAVVAQIKRSNRPEVVFYSLPTRAMVDICLDYAKTPLLEREDEKKYIVILPDPRNDGTHCQALFKGLYGICIGYVYRHDLQGFTESEIKRNHEYLWQFAKEVHE